MKTASGKEHAILVCGNQKHYSVTRAAEVGMEIVHYSEIAPR